jgi:hypothetical protein
MQSRWVTGHQLDRRTPLKRFKLKRRPGRFNFSGLATVRIQFSEMNVPVKNFIINIIGADDTVRQSNDILFFSY